MTIGSNLSLKIAAILLGGFILLQMLVWTVLALPGRGDARQPYNLPRPAQLRTMVELVETTPPSGRPALLGLLNSSLYTVRLLPVVPPQPATRRAGLEDIEARYEAVMGGHDVELSGRRPLIGRMMGERPWAGRFFAPITVTVPIRSGGVLVVDSRPSPVVRTWLRERAFLGALGGLIMLLILWLAVRQTTRPLVRLSRGVRRFSSDLTMPDLPVTGPRDIRELSAAFNEMKGQIAALIGERTRMLAGIAHDMRTYLTRLRLRAEFIADDGQREKAAADLAEMAMLLDDTLLFARRDAASAPDPVRINLAPELEAMVAIRREMGQPVTLDLGGVTPAIMADRMALRRIVSNLVDNGVRHGGAAHIVVRGEAHRVVVAVSDDGPGVPVAALARLGEPFGRLDPSRDRETGGAGLGLAIVRALAEREGAAVSFANREPRGFIATIAFRKAA